MKPSHLTLATLLISGLITMTAFIFSVINPEMTTHYLFLVHSFRGYSGACLLIDVFFEIIFELVMCLAFINKYAKISKLVDVEFNTGSIKIISNLMKQVCKLGGSKSSNNMEPSTDTMEPSSNAMEPCIDTKELPTNTKEPSTNTKEPSKTCDEPCKATSNGSSKEQLIAASGDHINCCSSTPTSSLSSSIQTASFEEKKSSNPDENADNLSV